MEIISKSLMVPLIKELESALEGKTDRKLIWFGSGEATLYALKYLKDTGRKVDALVDNNTKAQGKTVLDDIPVLSPEILLPKNEQYFIILASSHSDSMIAQLESYGYKRDMDIADLHLLRHHDELESSLLSKCKGLRPLAHREVQLLEFGILKYLRSICEKFGLRYFLGAGTMIGAVRHKGFIPWDDDIDVFMPNDDYLKLLEVFPKGGRYQIADWRLQEDYYLTFGKIADTNTLLFHRRYKMQYSLMGIYIDIFPLDGYPDSQEEIQKKYQENVLLEDEWYYYYNFREIQKLKDNRREIQNIKYGFPYDESNIIGETNTIKVKQWTSNKELFANTVLAEFEGESFPIPAGYDEHLRSRYGDYMQLPPENERAVHANPAFMKNLE